MARAPQTGAADVQRMLDMSACENASTVSPDLRCEMPSPYRRALAKSGAVLVGRLVVGHADLELALLGELDGVRHEVGETCRSRARSPTSWSGTSRSTSR